jgi:hypothetical protein
MWLPKQHTPLGKADVLALSVTILLGFLVESLGACYFSKSSIKWLLFIVEALF